MTEQNRRESDDSDHDDHEGHDHDDHSGHDHDSHDDHDAHAGHDHDSHDDHDAHAGHDHDSHDDHDDHAGHDHAHDLRGASRRSLILALVLISTYMVAEIIGGVISGSLALLADAGHMLTDAAVHRHGVGSNVDWRKSGVCRAHFRVLSNRGCWLPWPMPSVYG